ncbi:MAG: hypothetical protein FJ197_05975 [Gammaproteobacteria bacterium]|nr:hypothetical protein [Gammaproteobacteria bacterium]
MKKLAALAGIAALGLSAQSAFGYSTTATITVDIGGNGGGTPDASLTFGPSSTLNDIAWTSSGTATLSSISNSTYFTTLSGYNSRTFFNADFASSAQCAALVSAAGGAAPSTRKYGCRYTSYYGNPSFLNTPVTTDAGDLGPNPRATGTVTVTDTTLTGTLNIVATTDEPTGATTTTSPTGIRLSNSAGNGANGFNIRSADGSPFGNYWQGITTAATITLNLTGTFTATTWDITGGTARFNDSGFACQQGGLGATSDTSAGTLCTAGVTSGGQSNTGSHLSWGWDLDGSSTTDNTTSMINVRDAGGVALLQTLSGVLASISVDGAGNITTNAGEYRRALGSSGGGCGTEHIRYDGTKISCGTLTVGKLNFTGTVVPAPAAAWLLAPAILAAGRYARRRKAG